MINDVWALRFDAEIGRVAGEHGAPLVLMHNSQGSLDAAYPSALRREQEELRAEVNGGDSVSAIRKHLAERMETAQSMGIARWQLLADPGIGFGKQLSQNLAILRRLAEIKTTGYPLLVGSSRKGFIGRLLGGLPPDQRVEGTLATNVLAAVGGADVVRVHDVQAAARCLRVADAVLREYPE